MKRKQFAEELVLRENVRKAIKHVLSVRRKEVLDSQRAENQLREVIRSLLPESQTAVTTSAKHDSTGINTLEDLLKNSNILSVLETGYKSLTSTREQRISYKNHILNAVQKAMAPEEERKHADTINEEINIDIEDRPEDDPDFIPVEEPEEVEVDEKDVFGIPDEDKTGRNKAFSDFSNVDKVILSAFDDLDDDRDRELFSTYLIKNLSLYFDKFETELEVNVPEPEIAQQAEPDADVPPEEDIANLELEESVDINLANLIENLL
tara:strand:+ start:2159 stop:2953 length:795 start_codon:yes stop_codon:yes gene_type:complete